MRNHIARRWQRMLLALLGAITSLLMAIEIQAAPLDGLALVGKARMQVLFWKVYDARLYSSDGLWRSEPPFALSLTYLRKLQGERIAERSVSEIRKQGYDDEITLARWYEMLAGIIPDVTEQDEIIGVATVDGRTDFYLNGELIGTVPEPAFTARFFAIWLSEQTSEPDFRRELLGDRS